MLSFEYAKIEKILGFYQIKFGSNNPITQKPSPLRDRLFMLLNMISCLILLIPNILWGLCKIIGSLIATTALYSFSSFASLFTEVNFNKAHSMRNFFGKECIHILFDLVSIPALICFFLVGIVSPNLCAKLTNSRLFDRINDLVITTVREDAVSAVAVGILHLIRPKTITLHGLNPSELTETQKKYPPIFCVHGYRSSQAAWLPLAEYFEKMNYPGAIFVIDVPAEPHLTFPFSADTPEYFQSLNRLKDKIDEVMGLYPESMKSINLIGHSRGSWVITDVGTALKSRFDVNAISLDNGLNYRGWELPHRHLHIESSRYNTSHSGMLFNRSVLRECYDSIMKSRPQKTPHLQQSIGLQQPLQGKHLRVFTQETTEPDDPRKVLTKLNPIC